MANISGHKKETGEENSPSLIPEVKNKVGTDIHGALHEWKSSQPFQALVMLKLISKALSGLYL